jgi:hypothetical protein
VFGHLVIVSFCSAIFYHGPSSDLSMLHSRGQWLFELIGEPLVFESLLTDICSQAPYVGSCLCYVLTMIQILDSDAMIINEPSRPKNSVHEIQVLSQVGP